MVDNITGRNDAEDLSDGGFSEDIICAGERMLCEAKEGSGGVNPNDGAEAERARSVDEKMRLL